MHGNVLLITFMRSFDIVFGSPHALSLLGRAARILMTGNANL